MGLSHLDVVRGVLGSVLAILSPFLAGAVIPAAAMARTMNDE